MRLNEIRIYRLLTALESMPKGWLSVAIVGLIFILGIVDYFTGIELSISFFYLIPVSMGAWALGKYLGLSYSVLSATVWLLSNSLSGQTFSNIVVGVWNTEIRFGFYGVVTILLAELHNALEEEQLLSSTDPLTGALNRRSFNELAEKRMVVAEVNRRPYTLVYIDLDNFKPVNDKFGHATGDQVLKAVVDTLQTQIRNTDFLARLGGDEFALLLTDIDREHAENIVRRLQTALLESMTEQAWEITFSIGALTFLAMPGSVNEMVSLTDALMYEVKTGGKNAIKYSTYDY
ncbi:MAG: GGDEF domain-containing protein [Chloroflexota bacterium]